MSCCHSDLLSFIQRIRKLLTASTTLTSACSDDQSDANILSPNAGSFRPGRACTTATVTKLDLKRTIKDEELRSLVSIPVNSTRCNITAGIVRVKGSADIIGRGEISFTIGKRYNYTAVFLRGPAYLLTGFIGCTGERVFPMTGKDIGRVSIAGTIELLHVGAGIRVEFPCSRTRPRRPLTRHSSERGRISLSAYQKQLQRGPGIPAVGMGFHRRISSVRLSGARVGGG